MSNDLLSKRERAEFNTRLDLGRIEVARKHVDYVQDDNCEPIAHGAWVLFIKDFFFAQLRDQMRSLSFHSDVYDELHSLVVKRQYKDMIVTLESEAEGNIWTLCEEFIVCLMQRNAQGFMVAFSSRGKDFIQMNHVKKNTFKTSHGHDCSRIAVLYGRCSENEYRRQSPKRNRCEFVIRPGQLWRCEGCGIEVYDTDVDPEPLMKRYNTKFPKEDTS